MTTESPERSASRRNPRVKRFGGRLALYLTLLVATLYTVYPLIAAAGDGMGFDFAALFAAGRCAMIGGQCYFVGIFHFNPTYYIDAFTLGHFPARIVNTLLIAGLSVGTAISVGIPAAYVLARIDIRGRTALSMVLLALRTISPFAVVIPLYIVFTRAGLWNTYQGVALVELMLVLTVVVWMVKGFFQEIPKSVYESASMFGASEGQIFWRVALPTVVTGVLVTALFGFILVWNEYLVQVIMTGPATSSVSVGVFSGLGSMNRTPSPAELEAAAVLAFLPSAAVLLGIRRYLAKGFSLAVAR